MVTKAYFRGMEPAVQLDWLTTIRSASRVILRNINNHELKDCTRRKLSRHAGKGVWKYTTMYNVYVEKTGTHNKAINLGHKRFFSFLLMISCVRQVVR